MLQNSSSAKPNDSLINIVKGNVTKDAKEENIIIGSKLRNEVIRKLADAFRNKKHNERYIVEILLALDEATEKGYLTNELFEEIKNNPEILINKK